MSYLKPEHFDWREFLRIDLVEDETTLSTGRASSPDDSVAALSMENGQKQLEKTSVAPAVQEPPPAKHRPSRIGYTFRRLGTSS